MDEELFLEAIASNPYAGAPRLAFADWLDKAESESTVSNPSPCGPNLAGGRACAASPFAPYPHRCCCSRVSGRRAAGGWQSDWPGIPGQRESVRRRLDRQL